MLRRDNFIFKRISYRLLSLSLYGSELILGSFNLSEFEFLRDLTNAQYFYRNALPKYQLLQHVHRRNQSGTQNRKWIFCVLIVMYSLCDEFIHYLKIINRKLDRCLLFRLYLHTWQFPLLSQCWLMLYLVTIVYVPNCIFSYHCICQ